MSISQSVSKKLCSIIFLCLVFTAPLTSTSQTEKSETTTLDNSGSMQETSNFVPLDITRFGIMEDISMSQLKPNQRPQSDWIEHEKAFNRDLLKNTKFDVLVVPFQVQGYAVDRIGRSLITRYLSNRIASSTEAKVPSPTLVARALGENERSFDEKEIYRLANDLNVKTLILGYAGHNRDEKMIITLLVQLREKDEPLSPETNVIILNWKDIPFSDERPPSEAFLSYLDNVMSKLPLKVSRKPETIYLKKISELPVPETISDMVTGKSDSPVVSAYYMQLLGMLFPENTTGKEYLFERSLVALISVSPKSPDYALLKSRAFFYLHRRPSAVAALGKASTSEGKSLSALLNGNLPELKKSTDEIKSPFHKLMAQIELNDLRRSYKENVTDKDISDISVKFPDWELILKRRLLNKDKWDIQSNIDIKIKLDEVFPIPDFTADNIATSRLTMGESPVEGDEIDFSAYNHYHEFIKDKKWKFCCEEDSANLTERDYLDLLNEIAESNLLKKARLSAITRALPDEALQVIGKFDAIYHGHPEMAAIKSRALHDLSDKNRGQARENLKKEFKENAYNAYYWAQGQNGTAYEGYVFAVTEISPFPPAVYLYDADYPRRPYWAGMGKGDRAVLKQSLLSKFSDQEISESFKNREVDLLYTHDDFSILADIYKGLLSRKKQVKPEDKSVLENALDKFLEINRYRFIGHPDKVYFDAEHTEKQAYVEDKSSLYEQAIAQNPGIWESYMKLGMMYIQQGKFDKARTAFLRYPLFLDKERDSVKMSNKAAVAGEELLWVGAVDDAIPLLRLSADSETGSEGEMSSLVYLSLLGGNYPEAAAHSMERAKRYDSDFGYRDYLIFLYLMGYHKEASALFHTIDIQSTAIWGSVLIGQRIEGKTNEDIVKWLSQDTYIQKISFDRVGRHLFMTHFIDRPPVNTLPGIIKEFNWNAGKEKDKWEEIGLKSSKDIWTGLAEAYYAFRTGKYELAYETFKKNRFFDLYSNGFDNTVFPYIYISAFKSAKLEDFENWLSKKEYFKIDEFYSNLLMAGIDGLKGDHDKAIDHLNLASYRVPGTGSRPFYGWYQLVEICEFLFKETKVDKYRELALKWAKTHQRIQPMYAWAYAVEAKYTDSYADRTRALALALYLDKQSEHIAHFSDNEREKALEWLKLNNPFLKGSKQEKNLL